MEDATLYRRLAEENGMTFSPVDELLPRVQPQLMEVFSRSFLDSHHIIPLEISERNLLVATDDPDSSVEDILRMHPYDRVVKVLVTLPRQPPHHPARSQRAQPAGGYRRPRQLGGRYPAHASL
jgi:hypothetical protein